MKPPTKITLWQPVSFPNEWQTCTTSKFDMILPSWERRREELKSDEIEYTTFVERLKRQHAIETGIVEKIYDLKQGITQTFITEGFRENLLSESDTNISKYQLMQILNDHLSAIDFVFDLIKSERNLSKSFILELHQLVTRNQTTTDAIDQFGNVKKIALLRGKFKELPNNPQRHDGTLIEYSPPVHVDSEIDNLLKIYLDLEDKKIHPIIIAAWFHHSFSIIHPFQDGNGRISRLLTSIILIKHGFFPFTVKREDKKAYIDSLETADKGIFQPIVRFFSLNQIEYIEAALNWQTKVEKNYIEVLQSLKDKLNQSTTKKQPIETNRQLLYDICRALFDENISKIKQETEGAMLEIFIKKSPPNAEKSHYYTARIAEIARRNNYHFNKNLTRAWVEANFQLKKTGYYKLVISLHHYGLNDSTIAVAAFMEYGQKPKHQKDIITAIPINLKPFVFSVDTNINTDSLGKMKLEMDMFIKEIFTIAVAQITQEA